MGLISHYLVKILDSARSPLAAGNGRLSYENLIQIREASGQDSSAANNNLLPPPGKSKKVFFTNKVAVRLQLPYTHS